MVIVVVGYKDDICPYTGWLDADGAPVMRISHQGYVISEFETGMSMPP